MYHNLKLGTLGSMSGEDPRNRGTTKRFTREELAALADQARGDAPPAPAEITPMSRAQTLHDPMTTQLLAEVARRLQTMELEVPEGVVEQTEAEELDTAHPHLRRRR
jgi:hypothetical protein